MSHENKDRLSKPVLNDPQLVDNIPQRDHNIQFNQFGHLTASSDAHIRYYSNASWVSSVENIESLASQQPHCGDSSEDAMESSKPFQLQTPASSPKTLDQFQDWNTYSCIQLEEVDQLFRWYLQYCHFWFPIVDIPDILQILQTLRSCRISATGSSALIAAICYSASCSAEAASDLQSFSVASSLWKDLTLEILSKSGYPLRASLNTIRAAFLIAAPSMAEWKAHPDPTRLCVLVRAAHSLGLHREPSVFKLCPRESDQRRVLWWSIHALDMSYAVVHGLPPLIHRTNFDVQMISSEDNLYRKMLKTLLRVNLQLSNIFEDIYGIHQPTRIIIQQLDKEVAQICTEELAQSQLSQQSTQTGILERFIATSQRLCCWKMIFILHQLYLRSTQWPRDSRRKALDACRNHINEFSQAITDSNLAPYRWVLSHFNVTHACAIVLQDLVQYPNSTEDLPRFGV